jgi:hypothetical protein
MATTPGAAPLGFFLGQMGIFPDPNPQTIPKTVNENTEEENPVPRGQMPTLGRPGTLLRL